MAYLSAALKATLEIRLARYETMLTAAYAAMDDLAEQSIDRYELDTGEGRQEVFIRKVAAQQKHILFLEATIDHIRQRLAGKGVVALTMKRRF